MSCLFESFEFLDRGWHVRALENQSLRSVFVWLQLLVFVLGAATGLTAYQVLHLHRFDWSVIIKFGAAAFLTFRYTRMIYRRLK
jgi:hypothetical protein